MKGPREIGALRAATEAAPRVPDSRVGALALAAGPWRAASLTDTVLFVLLPAHLSLVSYELHFLGNLMDAIEPTAEELDHQGVVTRTLEGLRIELDELQPRETPGSPGPRCFRDLVDVDLLQEGRARRVPGGRGRALRPVALQ